MQIKKHKWIFQNHLSCNLHRKIQIFLLQLQLQIKILRYRSLQTAMKKQMILLFRQKPLHHWVNYQENLRVYVTTCLFIFLSYFFIKNIKNNSENKTNCIKLDCFKINCIKINRIKVNCIEINCIKIKQNILEQDNWLVCSFADIF